MRMRRLFFFIDKKIEVREENNLFKDIELKSVYFKGMRG